MNLDQFVNAPFALRQAAVDVPELAAFFDEGEKAEWTVRALTAAELGRAKESAERGVENIRAMIQAMAGEGDKAESIQNVMGVSQKEVPEDVSRRIEMLVHGSVSPEIGPERREVVVKLAETFPTIFYKLTTQILTLTGQGADEGKRKRSGKAAA